MIIKGCFFHYTQCICRETQKCGLQTYYKENDDIEDVWFNVLQDIGDTNNVRDTTTFTDYVTEHWV